MHKTGISIAVVIIALAPGMGAGPTSSGEIRPQQGVYGEQSELLPTGVSRMTPEELENIPLGKQNYAISIIGPGSPIKYGSRLGLKVVLMNVSRSPVELYIPWTEYDPDVRDADGKAITPTFLADPDGIGSGILYSLLPGYKLTTEEVLPKQFRASMKPGIYTVRLTLDRRPKNGVIDWSNEITVTIIP